MDLGKRDEESSQDYDKRITKECSLITDEIIRSATLNLCSEGSIEEAEAVLHLWHNHQLLKEEAFRLVRQLNTQVPITVEHSKH